MDVRNSLDVPIASTLWMNHCIIRLGERLTPPRMSKLHCSCLVTGHRLEIRFDQPGDERFDVLSITISDRQ